MSAIVPVNYEERVTALEELWRRWADVGADLTEAEWERETRCPGWNVRAVFAHHSMFPLSMTTAMPPSVEPGVAGLTAAEVLVRFNEPQGIAHTMKDQVAASAVALSEVATDELVNRFRLQGPEAVAALRKVDPQQVVPWVTPQTPMAIHELIRIVLMEATVHLLDVYDGLQRPCDIEPRLLGHTVTLLAEMAPPVAFIEAATGRSPRSPLPVLR